MTFAIFLTYVKKYWQVALLIVGVIVGVVIFRRKDISFVEDYQKIQDVHKKELDAIQAANDEERKKLQANQAQLQTALDTIQKQYDSQQKQLDDAKKAEIAQIVKDHGNDPDALAQKLSDATGFKVILPTS